MFYAKKSLEKGRESPIRKPLKSPFAISRPQAYPHWA
jgi:hypothetical protein